MTKRATRKGVTPAKRSPKRKKQPPRAATAPEKPAEDRGPGRPSLYRPEHCQALLDYFTFREPEHKVVGEGAGARVVTIPPMVPTFAGFADTIGVHPDTLLEWCDKHEEFSGAYARARARLEHHLINHGCTGVYAQNFTQFILKSRLGLKEPEAESTLKVVGGGPGAAPIQTEETVKIDPETAGALARLTLRMKTAGGAPKPR